MLGWHLVTIPRCLTDTLAGPLSFVQGSGCNCAVPRHFFWVERRYLDCAVLLVALRLACDHNVHQCMHRVHHQHAAMNVSVPLLMGSIALRCAGLRCTSVGVSWIALRVAADAWFCMTGDMRIFDKTGPPGSDPDLCIHVCFELGSRAGQATVNYLHSAVSVSCHRALCR